MTDLMIESFPAAMVVDACRPLHGVSVASTDPTVLVHIRRPEVNLAIWHRDTSAFLNTKILRRFMRAAPFTIVAESLIDDMTDRLSAQLPASVPFDLVLDLADLAFSFATINHAIDEPVRIRLDAQHHADCCGWQADMGLCLQCTYCGPGIEWLVRDGGAMQTNAASAFVANNASIQLATSAVAILKGDEHPGNKGNGCIHRSPRIMPGSGPRLQVCIDQPLWSLIR